MMNVNRLKLLIVTLVALLSLALGASSTFATHKQGPNSNPQTNCGVVLEDQFWRQNKNKPFETSTNCSHIRN
jgi:hypothetical protein